MKNAMLLSESDAMRIALRFFEQQNSNVVPISAFLKEDSWQVTVSMGVMDRQTRQVKIDSKTGRITGYA
jgi:hypothetical protein